MKSLIVKNNLFSHGTSFTPAASYQCISINGDRSDTGLILIEENVVDVWKSAALLIRGSVAIPNIRIIRNRFRNCNGTSLADNALGAYPDNIEVIENEFTNTDVTKNVQVQIGGDGAKVNGNIFYQYGEYNLRVKGTNVRVENNKFINPNPTAVASRGPILLEAAGTYYVLNNLLSGGTNSYFISDASATTVIEYGNISYNNVQIMISTPTKVANDNTFISNNGRRTRYGTALPVSGVHYPGELFIITAPAEGQGVEYQCVTAGNPGTWRMTRQAGVKKNTTANRPTVVASDQGLIYLDTTLDADGKPIWYNGTAWVDATGVTV